MEEKLMRLVVVGLGYVGLPLALQACRSGINTVGLDASKAIVDSLTQGTSHVDDLSDDDVRFMLDQGFTATSDPATISGATDVVICVPTPLGDEGGPDLGAVENACLSIAPYIDADTLVVLESTTYPGTTQEVVARLLAEHSDVAPDRLLIAYSPERIDPGNVKYTFRNTPKIVGADDPLSSERVTALYRLMVDSVVEATGTREAESAKLLENTYRHVNIALVNEMSKFFRELDIDIWEVIRLASTKPFGFQAFFPGPGVGGHCIPIDPNYLSHRVRTQLGYPFRFVELAQEINASMPNYVVSRVIELLNSRAKAMNGSRVLLLGVTYKPDISDQRESPAVNVANRLQQLGAQVFYCDPYVEDWYIADTQRVDEKSLSEAAKFDVTVVLQAHQSFDLDALAASGAVVLDTRGAMPPDSAERL